MPRAIRRLAAAALLVCAPALVWAADAQTQLAAFIANVQSAQGTFTQATQVLDGNKPLPAQRGQFAFQRPGKFDWHVTAPFEQRVVSDGAQLWQYDPDLAQVTVRPVDRAVGSSPAAILFGAGKLEDVFNVALLPDHDGLQWLRATPKNGDAGFKYADIAMQDNLPARIDLLDAFGQTTHVVLLGIQVNPSLPADTFRFAPPPGVDVVKM